jgi:CBS domain-containing protein
VFLVKVRDGMSHLVLTVGPAHTLRQAARMMSARHVGAAVVVDPEHAGVGILTERDILDSIAGGEDPDAELAGQHRTGDLVYASPDWTLEKAAQAMIRGGFRHLVVVEGQDVAGLLSMRDIVRCWTAAGAPHGEAPVTTGLRVLPGLRVSAALRLDGWARNGPRAISGWADEP